MAYKNYGNIVFFMLLYFKKPRKIPVYLSKRYQEQPTRENAFRVTIYGTHRRILKTIFKQLGYPVLMMTVNVKYLNQNVSTEGNIYIESNVYFFEKWFRQKLLFSFM